MEGIELAQVRRVVGAFTVGQAGEGELCEMDHALGLIGFGDLDEGRLDQVLGHGPADEDGMLADHVCGDRDLPGPVEGHGGDEALPDQLRADDVGADVLHALPLKLHKVDLHPPLKVVLQRLQEGGVVGTTCHGFHDAVKLEEAGMDEIGTKGPKGTLLFLHGGVQQTAVHQAADWGGLRVQLELHSHPPVALVVLAPLLGHHRVCKCEELGLRPVHPERLLELLILSVQHLLQALLGDESVTLSVDVVTHLHVVGAHGLGNGTGGGPHIEEDATDLGSRPNLSNGAVGAHVQVHL
mmetsp:Transcript_10187/g.17994  ORF Transcript_10187/g.17994 Transcript_10187/m.17994 type:complete len:296 (-) Transcript_10187:737-1624(-)